MKIINKSTLRTLLTLALVFSIISLGNTTEKTFDKTHQNFKISKIFNS